MILGTKQIWKQLHDSFFFLNVGYEKQPSTMPSTLDLTKATIGTLINTASGSCDDTSERAMLDIMQSLKIGHVQSWCADANTLQESLSEVGKAKLDVLVVLGGDGTIRSAIKAVEGSKTHVIPLPGGTMNMLPKALYGERTWQEALTDTLQNPEVRPVSAGRIEDDSFFVAAIVGSVTEITSARESLREGKVMEAAKKGVEALSHAFDSSIHFQVDGGIEQESAAIALICPLTSKVLSNSAPMLELIALNIESAKDIFPLLTAAASGEWRTASSVASLNIVSATLSSHSNIAAVLDGEQCEYGTSVSVSFLPAAFTTLVPATAAT